MGRKTMFNSHKKYKVGSLCKIYPRDGGVTEDLGLLIGFKRHPLKGSYYLFLVDGSVYYYNYLDYTFRNI